jgi:hypothetical protein
MTSSGMRWAFLFGFLLAIALPKHVDCGYPDAPACQKQGRWQTKCTAYEVEPFGFYLIELVAKRDVGFAYSSGDGCR